MRQHRFCSVQTAIVIIIAARMAVSSSNQTKKTVDLVFVVERTPLADPGWTEFVDGYIASQAIHGWIDNWLLCMEWDKEIEAHLDAGYMAFALDITRDKVETISSFTYSLKEMRENCYSGVVTWTNTQPRPTRLQETPAIVKKLRDAIKQPHERKGVPVLLMWHVPYVYKMEPHDAILNLTKTRNGPEAVIGFATLGPHQGQRMTHICFDCHAPTKLLFKYGTDPLCHQFQPYINKLLEPLWKCETVTTHTQCYFDEWRDCLTDSMYAPKDGTHAKYVKYCRSGLKTPGEKCGKDAKECEEQCKRIMKQEPCSVSCGNGTTTKVRPAVTDKFTRNCPESIPVVCAEPPCPTTPTPRPITTPTKPALTTTTALVTRRPVTTRRTTALITEPSTTGDQAPETASPFTQRSFSTRATPVIATPSMPVGTVLEPWMIAVLVVAAVAVLAVMIGVLACCLRKRRRPAAAGTVGHRNRLYTRRSAPGRYDSVARSPSRTHDRQPPRYRSRPRAPSPTDRQRPHAHTRPTQTPTRPAHARSRLAYASLPATSKGTQPPRHR